MSPATDAAVVALALTAWALVSARSRRWPLTMPMVMVAAGLLTHWVGVSRTEVPEQWIGVVGEIALAVVLFSDAVRIDLRALRRERGLPLRLLGIGLPLSLVLGTGIVAVVVPGLGIWEAALLAAILAPTDPALGQAVVDDESVPLRVRQALNVESGLNDGLVLPVVLLFIALSGGTSGRDVSFPVFAAQQIGLGAVVGLAVGAGAAYLLRRADESGWVEGLYAQLATLSVAALALAVALASGGNGFVACFVAGLVFGTISRDGGSHLVEYSEDSGQLLSAISFFLFGNVLLPAALDELSWTVALCAAALLTVGRLVPVAVSLIGSGTAPQTVAFIGWFGPRGLASVVFGILLLEQEVAKAGTLAAIVSLTVTLSVVAHGATAGWGAQRFGRWAEAASRHDRSMPEVQQVHEHRSRGWRGRRQP